MLVAEQLHCERDERVLFTHLNFTLNTGQLLHIAGNNGAGKTSLIKILAGLLSATSGNVLWQQQSLAHCKHEYYQQLCYIGHQHAMNMQLTAYENLTFASAAYATQMSVMQALQQLAMQHYANIRLGQLSAGQRRRIALAKLCLIRASLWLLDEPYTSLDQHSSTIINEMITQHILHGGMVALTSHQPIYFPQLNVQSLVLSAEQ